MDLTKEKFLVTGAAGFVGASLTRRLVDRGFQVHACVSPGGDVWRIKDVLPSLTLHRGDMTDEVFVKTLISQVRPSIIYHLAAYGAYPVQTDTKRILMTNILGTSYLLKALEEIPYSLFVNTGSSSEYGFKKKAMQESDLPEPNSYYAVAKLAQTMMCQYVAQCQKKPVVTFRLFSVYGPYEDPKRLVVTIIRRCLGGEDLHMASPHTARDFIYVDDVVDAYLNIESLIKHGGEVFNIGTGCQVSLKEITELVLELTQAKVNVHWNAMQDRIWDTSFWVGDVSKAQTMLKWQAKTALKQGIIQTMEWLKKQ